MFVRHVARIAPHAEISGLSGLASDEDAVKPEYIKAGRYGSEEAVRRISAIAKKHGLV